MSHDGVLSVTSDTELAGLGPLLDSVTSAEGVERLSSKHSAGDPCDTTR